YQDLTRIELAIRNGDFAKNPELLAACRAAGGEGTLHLLGLLSPGGVHSHEDHLFAMIDLALAAGAGRIAVHACLDGRDTPPRSARPSLQRLVERAAGEPRLAVYSVGGRYYAMDRDQRWDRVQKAWSAIVDADSPQRAADPLQALEAAYARDENDEFVLPTVIDGARPMADGDAVVFMNFRADRARQLTAAFVSPAFDGFQARVPALARFVCLTEYDARLPAPVAFAPDDL